MGQTSMVEVHECTKSHGTRYLTVPWKPRGAAELSRQPQVSAMIMELSP